MATGYTNILDLCSEVTERDGTGSLELVAHPRTLYPAVIARIREVVREGLYPVELEYDPATRNPGFDAQEAVYAWVKRVRKIPDEWWTLALTPRSEFMSEAEFVVAMVNAYKEPAVRQALGITDDAMFPVPRIATMPARHRELLAGMSEVPEGARKLLARSVALDLALSWFTEATRVASPTNRSFPRIERDEDFRL